jgi:ribulose 1,5-bisphosphate carboxylase large subunit-like protein
LVAGYVAGDTAITGARRNFTQQYLYYRRAEHGAVAAVVPRDATSTAITVARRNFPEQFLHYHRAGLGAVASLQTQRGYTIFTYTKISRVIGASSIHIGTMSFGRLEDDASCGSLLGRKQLIRNGKHALVAYIMKPKAGYDYHRTLAP